MLPPATIPTIPGLVWEDWRSQLQHALRTLADLRRWINVTPAEEAAFRACAPFYRMSLTPYYAALMDRTDPDCPIRRQALPSLQELAAFPHATYDPVADTEHRKTRRVIHKYPDRAIILVTEACGVYCRHCTRKFHTSAHAGTYFDKGYSPGWEADFEYIEKTPALRDILLTGGDPLTLPDTVLEKIIRRLRQIPHIEIIRLGSRYPVYLPQRITPALCQMLDRYQPIWLNTHFNHPKEITPAAAAACDRLTRQGIPVQNQSVLLKGVNDRVETLRALFTGLLQIHVRPYYLYHCDNAISVSHFATRIEEGRALMRGLQGFITGFAVPQYVLTTPLGKIPLNEEAFYYQDGEPWVKNYAGQCMPVKTLLTEDPPPAPAAG